jgi:flagellar FliL protein
MGGAEVSQISEQRVVAAKPKIGARPTAPVVAPEPAEETKGGKKGAKGGGGGAKTTIIAVLAVLVVCAAAYFFLLKPKNEAGAAAVVEEPAPEPGAVLVVEPISLNLADGHYLRIGIGMQLTADVAEEPDTARALDIVVALFSQRPVSEVTSADGRESLKAQLLAELEKAYEGEVMDVYFTDYVTQ